MWLVYSALSSKHESYGTGVVSEGAVCVDQRRNSHFFTAALVLLALRRLPWPTLGLVGGFFGIAGFVLPLPALPSVVRSGLPLGASSDSFACSRHCCFCGPLRS